MGKLFNWTNNDLTPACPAYLRQWVIYKLPSLHRDDAGKMIHGYPHWIFGVILLCSNRDPCWVRLMNKWPQPLPTFSESKRHGSVSSALHMLLNLILEINHLWNSICDSCFTDGETEAWTDQVPWLDFSSLISLLEVGWPIHPTLHATFSILALNAPESGDPVNFRENGIFPNENATWTTQHLTQ